MSALVQAGEFPVVAERYRLDEVLGMGGMGVVYRSFDLRLERIVALKTLRIREDDDAARHESLIRRFIRECKVVAGLAHPNIVTVYDAGAVDDFLFLVMEYVRGQTLGEALRARNRFTLADAVDCIAQVCEGLAVAHEQGVVHRDLKPANIMLLDSGLVKLMDFGLAYVEQATRLTAGVVGTPDYMPPEQIRGQQVDHRADLFSLGVVLYQLLTGEKPFRGSQIHELLSALVASHPDPPSSKVDQLDPAVDLVVARLLEKNRDARYASAREAALALRSLIRPSLTAGETRPAAVEAPVPRAPEEFEILEKIGEGGMGVVYKARERMLERTVALKVLNQHIQTHETAYQRFLKEARLSAALVHPNIVVIHKLGLQDGQPFIAMEYLPGRNLQQVLRSGTPLDSRTKLRVAVQVARALQHAHSQNVLHRDVKPANIRLLPDGTVKLMDFGIAKRMTEDVTKLTRTGLALGTVSYMAPEQLRGQPPTVASDIFSFGVVLHELLTGRNPFEAEPATAVVYRILEHEVPPIEDPEIPAPLARLVAECLAKLPEQRPQSFDVVLQRLLGSSRNTRRRKPVSGELSEAKPAAAAEPSSRLQWVLIATVLLLLGAVGAIGATLAVRWFGRAIRHVVPRQEAVQTPVAGVAASTPALPLLEVVAVVSTSAPATVVPATPVLPPSATPTAVPATAMPAAQPALPTATATLPPSPPATLAPSPPATLAPSPPATLAPSPSATLAPSPSATLAPSPSATLAPSPTTTRPATRTPIPRPPAPRAGPLSTGILPSGKTPPPTHRPPPATPTPDPDRGILRLAVDPPATVQIDGRGRELQTPLEISLPSGVHYLSVYRDGYEPLQPVFSLDPGQVFELDLKLEPLP